MKEIGAITFEDSLDRDGELEYMVECWDYYYHCDVNSYWMDKKDAIEIVEYLTNIFNLKD